jgi:hypothetical protein
MHALFADVDATDALVAGIRLADQQREVAWEDIHTEACRIGKERLARSAGPDPDSDAVRHYRTNLPEVLTSMISLQVPCPWCGAARGEACSVSGRDVSRTPAHSARLIAVGLTGPARAREGDSYDQHVGSEFNASSTEFHRAEPASG